MNQIGSTVGRFPAESSASRTVPRPLPGREPSMEDARAPWATGEVDKHPPSPDITEATEANLGPRRTSSPDTKLATMEGEEGRLRRGSVGTGCVWVAETGDLKKTAVPISVLNVGLKASVILSLLLPYRGCSPFPISLKLLFLYTSPARRTFYLYSYNSKITEHPRVTIGIR